MTRLSPARMNFRQAHIQRIDARELPALARVAAALPPPGERRDDFPAVLETLLSGLLARPGRSR